MKKSVLFLLAFFAVALTAVELPLRNPQFKMENGKIAHWTIIDVGAEITTVPYPDVPGTFAVKISSDKVTKYFGIAQGGFDFSKFPRPKAGEKLQFTLKYRQKNENVADGGFSNVVFYSNKGRLISRDSPKRSGTFDWTDVETSIVFKEFPPTARFMQVRFFLGKTTGTVYIAEPKLYVNIIK